MDWRAHQRRFGALGAPQTSAIDDQLATVRLWHSSLRAAAGTAVALVSRDAGACKSSSAQLEHIRPNVVDSHPCDLNTGQVPCR